jgi:hypothetical protein
MPLSPEAQNILRALSGPIADTRRPEFMQAVTAKIEAAGPAAAGPGALHRTAREVLGQFWTAPPDLRQGRVGPRGPRNA